MNMKLITTLAVAIALISALTFVALYKKQATAPVAEVSTVPSAVQAPNVQPVVGQKSSQGATMGVTIGAPGANDASVTIVK